MKQSLLSFMQRKIPYQCCLPDCVNMGVFMCSCWKTEGGKDIRISGTLHLCEEHFRSGFGWPIDSPDDGNHVWWKVFQNRYGYGKVAIPDETYQIVLREPLLFQ